MLRLIEATIDAGSKLFRYTDSTTEAAARPPLPLRREFRIDNMNTVGMEQPVPDVFGFTKSYLRQFSGMSRAFGFDLDRTLADLGFMPVLAEHILHKSSDIAGHAGHPSGYG